MVQVNHFKFHVSSFPVSTWNCGGNLWHYLQESECSAYSRPAPSCRLLPQWTVVSTVFPTAAARNWRIIVNFSLSLTSQMQLIAKPSKDDLSLRLICTSRSLGGLVKIDYWAPLNPQDWDFGDLGWGAGVCILTLPWLLMLLLGAPHWGGLGCGRPLNYLLSAPLCHSLHRPCFSPGFLEQPVWLAGCLSASSGMLHSASEAWKTSLFCGSLKSCGDSWATAPACPLAPGLSLPTLLSLLSQAELLIFASESYFTLYCCCFHLGCLFSFSSTGVVVPSLTALLRSPWLLPWSGSTLFALKPDSLLERMFVWAPHPAGCWGKGLMVGTQ